MGILSSVDRKRGGRGSEIVDAVMRCLKVGTMKQYTRLAEAFETETAKVQAEDPVDIFERRPLPARVVPKARCAMVIIRVTDSGGHPVNDFDVSHYGRQGWESESPSGRLYDQPSGEPASSGLHHLLLQL